MDRKSKPSQGRPSGPGMEVFNGNNGKPPSKVMTAEEFDRFLENEKSTTRITLSSERGPNEDGYQSDTSIDRALTSPAAFFNYVSNGPGPDSAQQGQQPRPQQPIQAKKPGAGMGPPAPPNPGPPGQGYPGVLPSRTHPMRLNSNEPHPAHHPRSGQPPYPAQQVRPSQPPRSAPNAQSALRPDQSPPRPEEDSFARSTVSVAPAAVPHNDTKSLADFLRTTAPDGSPSASDSKTKKKKNSFFGFGKKKKNQEDKDAKRGFPPMAERGSGDRHIPLEVPFDPFREIRPHVSHHHRHSDSDRRGNGHHASKHESGDSLSIPSHISNKEVRRSIIIAEDEGRFGAPLFDVSGSLGRSRRPDSLSNGSLTSPGSPSPPRGRPHSHASNGGGRSPVPMDAHHQQGRHEHSQHHHMRIEQQGTTNYGQSSPNMHGQQPGGPRPHSHNMSAVPNRLLPDESFQVTPFPETFSDGLNAPDAARQSSLPPRINVDQQHSLDPVYHASTPNQNELSQQQYFDIMRNAPPHLDDDDDWSDGQDYGFDGDDDDYDDFDDLDDETLANTEVNAMVNYGLKEAMTMAYMRPLPRRKREDALKVEFSTTMEECLGVLEDSEGEWEYGPTYREMVPLRDRAAERRAQEEAAEEENRVPLVIKSRGSSLAYTKDRDTSDSDMELEQEIGIERRPSQEGLKDNVPEPTRPPVGMETVGLQTPPDTPRPSMIPITVISAATSTLTSAAQRTVSLQPSLEGIPAPRIVSMSQLPTVSNVATSPIATEAPPVIPIVAAAGAAPAPRRKKVRHVQIQTRTPTVVPIATQTVEAAVSPELQQENTTLLAEVVRLRALVHTLTHERDSEREQFDTDRTRFNALSETAVRKIRELCRETEMYRVECECLKGVVEDMERQHEQWGVEDGHIPQA
ncbi:hypothetical protein DFJ77DRAFT_506245 [Powellomyces hirtus]|nr:hypothetical protein DFJ77DRAFT_506245 [Powellomyces hirtus]